MAHNNQIYDTLLKSLVAVLTSVSVILSTSQLHITCLKEKWVAHKLDIAQESLKFHILVLWFYEML